MRPMSNCRSPHSGSPPIGAFSLEEAFTRTVVTCRGARQRFRLDPETNPALIFRLLHRNEAE